MPLIIEDQKHYEDVISFAKRRGLYEGDSTSTLKSRLDYLHRYGGESDAFRVRLFKDSAPASFYFIIEKKKSDGDAWSRLFEGGLLFHGTHDGFGSGSAPTFAVTLTPTDGWSIHT